MAVLGAPAWGFTVTRRRLFVGEARSLSAERLPGYAPDLNPIAQVWGNVKSHELGNLCADTIGQVSEAAEDGLHRVSSDAPLCFAFLRHTGLRL